MTPTFFAIFLLLANIVMLYLLFRHKRRSKSELGKLAAMPQNLPSALDQLKLLMDDPEADKKFEEWTDFALEAGSVGLPYEDRIIISSDSDGADGFMLVANQGTGPLGDALSAGGVVPFNSQLQKHFFWSKEPQVINRQSLSQCLPAEYANHYNSALAATFRIGDAEAAMIILNRREDAEYSFDDKLRFKSMFRIIKAGYCLINSRILEGKLRDAIDQAHEEGMLQISTGIIHNIGNGILVIKIAMDNVGDFRPMLELVNFLRDELLEQALEVLVAGDPFDMDNGGKYLELAREVAEKLSALIEEQHKSFKEISVKFQNVIDTISLQQQFIGELGTENVVEFRTIIEDALTMSETPLNNNQIELEKEINTSSKVLADAALLRQVLLSLIKCSLNSINRIRRSPSVMKFKCFDQVDKGADTEDSCGNFICLVIEDNGYGVSFDNVSDATKSGAVKEHNELLFCKKKLEKYGGYLKLDSIAGVGSLIKLGLPIYSPDGNAPKPVADADNARNLPAQE